MKDRLRNWEPVLIYRMIKPAPQRGHRVTGIDAGQNIDCTQILNRWVVEQTCGLMTDGRYTSLQGVPKGIALRAKYDQLC